MLKITIDTSLIAETNSASLKYLIAAHQNKKLDVGVATRFRMDKDNDADLERLNAQKGVVSRLSTVASTFLIGHHYDDEEIGILADDDLHQQLFCLFNIDINTRGGVHSRYDVDHIYSHVVASRDVFLTYEEKRILKKRIVLKEVGANVAHPDKFVLAMQSCEEEADALSSEFRDKVLLMLDQLHPYAMNNQLLNQLNNIKKAQIDIKSGVFTEEDDEVISRLLHTSKLHSRDIPEQAEYILRKQYHHMKRTYLSRYPNLPLTRKNIVTKLREIYDL